MKKKIYNKEFGSYKESFGNAISIGDINTINNNSYVLPIKGVKS